MKQLFIITTLCCTLLSCTKKNEFEVHTSAQKWQLVKMTGQLANSESTGQDMAWQEYYLLLPNNTFIKSRMQNGETKEASGTYAYQELSDGKYLELTYEAESPLIGNCTTEPRELLKVETNMSIFSTWQACDGPGLTYKRVE